ncbi:response regulator transcription factor [Tessaracoccus sp. ZS01]|uniref:response regulator n=1 Tax=Tessaracoccus sp. ZS01 TaxID=1906324 RepID=UPI00096E92CC|nr:response regulator transcription factor [Tessaracoccus sp. ZS01]OMG57208.1 DNA-binding response regulator [Tessaracoccus sp. ZS01]
MPIRVMLVDDQELFRSAIRVIVNAQDDLEVVGEATDGEEAVALAAQLDPDVILMDIRMPGVDGVEATRRILGNAVASGSGVKVLVLTTFNLDDRAATAIRYGASGFLLKDITPQMLTDSIRTVHSGNGVIAPEDLAALLDSSFQEKPAPPVGFTQLSEKEHEVFALVAQGLSNVEIGQTIFASESTIKSHVGAILRKMGLRDRVQVVVSAYQHGLVDH